MLVPVYRVWNSDNIVKRKLKKCLIVMRQKLTINKKMLSVVSAAGVNAAAGMGGMERLGGGANSNSGSVVSNGNSATTVATSRDHRTQVRRLHAATNRIDHHSTTADITINLPPSIELPDGEEHPFTSARLHIRDAEQESEIYQKCIRPPPNRTVLESESPPPYRSCSAGMLSTSSSTSSANSDWSTSSNPLVVRCHSMSSTSSKPTNHSSHSVTIQKTDFLQRTVKIFTGGGKKTASQQTVYQPPPAPTLPVVIVPNVVRSQRVVNKPPADV
ncbi:uncharacterized protein LOC130899384 isoform X1 [Diorhabda carinulata]|uniref:uncharacterized protein LOC130449344 isoform X2 n=1 Tax=Diorhabda sublineata TaxID=1163346 RepID=UPI0024E083D2|nr:uncharacterized protein LOC130449344 isoform X2 [Diorhabda sublineata]XP_057665280.1 uncharacterized protein LOC130899384 isoform X1 [Diorhabda carinulata]